MKCFSILNFLFLFVVLYYERKVPSVMWAWVLILSLIPAGFLIYIIFGFEGKKHYSFLKKAKQDKLLESRLYSLYKSKKSTKSRLNSTNFYYTYNNLTLLHSGKDKFKALFNDINSATNYVYLEYYIIRNDFLGKALISLLVKKAKEGVDVRLLYDGMGNILTPRKFYKELINSGGYVKPFLSPYFFRINYRNHRKICVIDGKVGYVGGFNIGKEYIGKGKFGHWQDEHIKITGCAVKDLELRFINDWNFCSKHKINLDNEFFSYNEYNEKYKTKIQILSSGPDCEQNNIYNAYFKLICLAKKRIYIVTPYFVPDESILTALKIAGLSGIDVRIIFPANPDHPFVFWANLSYLGELLEFNVKCYKYNNGFIHSKLFLIDDEICSVGTVNMDIRSLKLNFEVTSIIYDENITAKYLNKIEEYLKECTEITLKDYNERSTTTKIKEAISRLVSPIL